MAKINKPYPEIYVENEVTNSILDGLNVGDLVKINDWKSPLKVYGVTKNYVAIAKKAFGKWLYSVIEKERWGGTRHNEMVGGYFHCGTDDLIFGDCEFSYRFEDEKAVQDYLDKFENDINHLSVRRAVPIHNISIKRGN